LVCSAWRRARSGVPRLSSPCARGVRFGTQAIGFLGLSQALNALLFGLEPRLLGVAPACGEQDAVVFAVELVEPAFLIHRLRGRVRDVDASLGDVNQVRMVTSTTGCDGLH
jgi:hypothetical protein